ncbi:MAG: phosphoribosylformylglycinamidine cyclo-ligase [Chloroflexota bacterium]|nr:phosphoribosylformylglycinamidine cyclo-ligase [Chloroflexota bacterium]
MPLTAESYRAAGVDMDAASAIKQVIHSYAKLTHGPQVLGGAGFFAGLYHLTDFRDPVLVASTDNVGTKLKVAFLSGHFESVGVDVVNQNVNDIITCGARPLFFLDYIAMGKLDPRAIELISRGISLACRQAGCALIGGETAELPGVYQRDAFDLAGFVVGAVERDAMIDGSTIVEGDVLLGIPSSGLHTNGYSLVRRIFDIDHTPSVLQRVFPELGKTLADELLTPHRGYWPLLEPVLPLVKGLGHITGGAWHKNVPRILPEGLAARVRLGAWAPPPIFKLIQQVGKISDAEMYRVFNMGIGMALAVAPDKVSEVRALLPEAFPIGDVARQRSDARIVFEG